MRRVTNAGIAPMPDEERRFAAFCRMLAATAIRDHRALIRVAKRESFRETVFLCSTPFVIAR